MRLGGATWALWRIGLATVTSLVEVSRAIVISGARAALATAKEALAGACGPGCAARDEAHASCSNHEERP